jgi:2-polyprenyl-3-methyl-5-hydroxy-6-metoxy-1,4-benzoquinol methylase
LVAQKLRKELFDDYREGQGEISSAAVYADSRAQWPYYDTNYLSYIECMEKQAMILEIGSGPGSLLSWLDAKGFKHLVGIDASPGDVAFANQHLGREIVFCGDGKEHLETHAETYDAIFMKAILEHQPKEELLPIIEAAAASIKQSGFILIDVPNMDWLFAGHERYMDLTHEVGFTPESLTALLRLRFEKVEVVGSQPSNLTRSQRLLRKPMVRLFKYAFYVLGEGAGDVMFESRSVIALARQPKFNQAKS